MIPEKYINDLLADERLNFINLFEIKDIDVLAGIIQNLDLIICIESDLAYLAGSLNIPTYLILPPVPMHYWDLSYKDSTPWYPSLELFSQQNTDDWDDIINSIKERVIDV
jgi:ADP-heptose:LPS heptosyltransferase